MRLIHPKQAEDVCLAKSTSFFRAATVLLMLISGYVNPEEDGSQQLISAPEKCCIYTYK